MPKQLKIMRGLPLSGKTTFVEKTFDDNNTVVISKKQYLATFNDNQIDFMSNMKYESLTKRVDNVIRSAFADQIPTIVLDDNNLHENCYLKQIERARIHDYEVQIIDIETPLDECLRRHRTQKFLEKEVIDKDVLINAAFQYGRTTQDRPFVLYELEGILIDTDHRFAAAELISTNSGASTEQLFFDPDLLDLDDLIEKNLDHIKRDYEDGYEIIFLTRRPFAFKEQTEVFLKNHNIPYSRLIMLPSLNYHEKKYKEYAMKNYLDMSKCRMVNETNLDLIELFDMIGVDCRKFGDETVRT